MYHAQVQKQLSEKHTKLLKKASYRRWSKLYQQIQAERPDREFLCKFYSIILKKRALKVLYNYRSYRKVQNTMNSNAQYFYSRSVLKKVFNQLMTYYYQRHLKHCRNEVAVQNYKRVIMNRWYHAKQRVTGIRYEILNPNQNLEFTSSYKNLNSNLRKSLKVIQSSEDQPLCIEDLNSTTDLVKAHDRLNNQIQKLRSSHSKVEKADASSSSSSSSRSSPSTSTS